MAAVTRWARPGCPASAAPPCAPVSAWPKEPSEITSPSTEDYDRGEKLRHYQQLASVREILIVSHRGPDLALHRREGSVWDTLEASAGERLELASVGVTLAVDAVYRDGLEDVTA